MKPKAFIDNFCQGLDDLLKSNAPQSIEPIKNAIKEHLSTTLSQAGFVSEEEFQIQKKVLLKTRQKVEDLEKRLDALLASGLK